jgi:hypothetical protein
MDLGKLRGAIDQVDRKIATLVVPGTAAARASRGTP